MVSKASEDFPEPLTPVTTVMALWGISKLMFLRLWTRAPRTRIDSCSGRTFEAAWVISLVAKGKPRQRVSRSLPKLQIIRPRSEEHTSELQSRQYLVCRLLLEKKKNKNK